MIVPTRDFEGHWLTVQQAISTKTQIIKYSKMTKAVDEVAVSRYPYLDVQIFSHVHPKFVICNIGWQSNSNLRRIKDHMFHFGKQVIRNASEIDSADERWIPRLRRLIKCVEIYGRWQAVEVGSKKVVGWKGEHPAGSGADSVLPVPPTTRSSQSRPMSQGQRSFTSTPMRQVKSHPGTPPRHK